MADQNSGAAGSNGFSLSTEGEVKKWWRHMGEREREGRIASNEGGGDRRGGGERERYDTWGKEQMGMME